MKGDSDSTIKANCGVEHAVEITEGNTPLGLVVDEKSEGVSGLKV